MKQVKLTQGRWLVLMSLLGAFSLAGPLPIGPATTKQQLLPFALLGLAYGWAAGLLTWRCVVGPVLDPTVPRERKRRITVLTFVVGIALVVVVTCIMGAGLLPR